jgi:ADP-ribose pyrophosphatase YjhB (NUDIX family)
MTHEQEPTWLAWAREIQALSQIGLAFADNEHQRSDFRRLREIAAEMVEYSTATPKEECLSVFSVQPGYATAKIDVRGAVIREGSILLVQEKKDGLWCMPGGWADVGELPSDMVAREVEEESGFLVKPSKLIGVFDANRSGKRLEFFHAYKIVFLCEILGGEPRSSLETLDVGFFSFDDLPPLSSNRTNERHLQEVRAHMLDPARLAAFD